MPSGIKRTRYLDDLDKELDLSEYYEQELAASANTNLDFNNNNNIPLDPQLFYQDFGYIEHAKSKKPVARLTHYQYNTWRDGIVHKIKFRLVIKSQKIGFTTAILMEDFQHAITDQKGREILIFAQSLKQAHEHLYTLRRMIMSSRKYRPFLITKPAQHLLRDETTKIGTLFIKNVDNEYKPTRIIALGSNEGAAWSWKNVGHVHFSDIAISERDPSGVIDAGISRLANTEGTAIIETPPAGPQGPIYDLYQRSRSNQPVLTANSMIDEDEAKSRFKVYEYDAYQAIPYGIISREWLDSERIRLGPMYGQYYEAKFIAGGGNLFRVDKIELAEQLGKQYPDFEEFEGTYEKAMGIDVGWGTTSKFAILVTERRNQVIRVIHADEFTRATYEEMIEEVRHIAQRIPGIDRYFVDWAGIDFIRGLKKDIGERSDFEQHIKDIAHKYSVEQGRSVDLKILENEMAVIPVSFGQYQGLMLSHAKDLVERGVLAVHPDKFRPLLDQMRSATEVNGKLDKSVNTLDLIDALRLSLLYYRLTSKYYT